MKPSARQALLAAGPLVGAVGGLPVAVMAMIVLLLVVLAGGGGGGTAAAPAVDVDPAAAACSITTNGYSGSPAPGLTITQTGHAWTILTVSNQLGMGERGATVGISVALAESTLLNLANQGSSQLTGWFPDGHRQLTDAERATARESLRFPHDSNPFGDNLDSIGLFQQRPSTGWGTPEELIDPATSATKFLGRLGQVSGWDTTTTPWQAGQTVQGSPSSDGGIYQRTYQQAEQIVTFLSNPAHATKTGTPQLTTTAAGIGPDAPAGTQLNGAQLAAAQTIIATGARKGIATRGVLVALTTALVETNLDPRAAEGPRAGLFLQLPDPDIPSTTDRSQPAGAAELFYAHLISQYPDYQTTPNTDRYIAETVQQHPIPTYGQWSSTAQAVQRTLAGTGNPDHSQPCTSDSRGPGTPATRGATVTLPDHPDVTPALRGITIPTPNSSVAKGIAAGLSWLGAPYVWGGGGDGEGPNDGCARGGGQLNSRQGLRGFDCSGLSAYVIVQAGYLSPGGDSSAQANPAYAVPWSSGQAGDLVLFTGHVAVYLGNINGTEYILEASTVGVPVHVVPLIRTSGRLPNLYRYWT